jgi:hypothetical protein
MDNTTGVCDVFYSEMKGKCNKIRLDDKTHLGYASGIVYN